MGIKLKDLTDIDLTVFVGSYFDTGFILDFSYLAGQILHQLNLSINDYNYLILFVYLCGLNTFGKP